MNSVVGVVIARNRRRGLAVAFLGNSCTVFDWRMATPPSIGDAISGVLDEPGLFRLHNDTSGKPFLAENVVLSLSVGDAVGYIGSELMDL